MYSGCSRSISLPISPPSFAPVSYTHLADVSKEADVVRLFDETARPLGPITALVNNVGIVERQTRLDQIDAARLQRVFSTNVFGSFLCAREAVRRMSTRYGGQGGAIVNVSSGAARIGAPNEYIDYAASKGAIDTLTLGLAKEVAEEKIRVNAVRPCLLYTSDGGLTDCGKVLVSNGFRKL